MAIFTSDIGNDSKRVADYLYQLNENLTYMFNNLTPEDNYSEDAKLQYIARGKKISMIEQTLNKIELKVQDDETNYNTSIRLLSNLLTLSAETPEHSSTVALTGDRITLTTGKFVVNATNLQIDAQGNAVFSGTVQAGRIISCMIDGGNEIPLVARNSYVRIGDFVVDDSWGRHIFQSYDEVTGMSTGDVESGQYLLWAGYGMSSTGDGIFLVNTGQVRINGTLVYKGQNIRSYIEDIVEEYISENGNE